MCLCTHRLAWHKVLRLCCMCGDEGSFPPWYAQLTAISLCEFCFSAPKTCFAVMKHAILATTFMVHVFRLCHHLCIVALCSLHPSMHLLQFLKPKRDVRCYLIVLCTLNTLCILCVRLFSVTTSDDFICLITTCKTNLTSNLCVRSLAA